MSSGRHPQTPQSPFQSDHIHEQLYKPSTSPRISNNLPTPAHSINGSMTSLTSETVYEQGQAEESSHKRKRNVEDSGDREQKKAHIEASRLSIDDLHLDVGKKYRLCKTPHPPRLPSLTDDLYAMYCLDDLAKSVARIGPDGQKGVKLRKTYKNHIKEHGVSGAFDSKKREINAPESLFMMMTTPEEQWENEHKRGKEIEMGLGFDDDALSRAFTMARGPIDKSKWDSSVLGELATVATPVDPSKTAQGRGLQAQGGPMARTKAAELARPKRSAKRTYQDSSFEGYGEGYVDDDSHDMGYSTGDGDDKGIRRKPKKPKNGPSHFAGSSTVRNGYGPGMVGA